MNYESRNVRSTKEPTSGMFAFDVNEDETEALSRFATESLYCFAHFRTSL
jgi:hypothetical protein